MGSEAGPTKPVQPLVFLTTYHESSFIIIFTIPLAFTGGLFALFFTGNEVSVIGMLGFVMLFVLMSFFFRRKSELRAMKKQALTKEES